MVFIVLTTAHTKLSFVYVDLPPLFNHAADDRMITTRLGSGQHTTWRAGLYTNNRFPLAFTVYGFLAQHQTAALASSYCLLFQQRNPWPVNRNANTTIPTTTHAGRAGVLFWGFCCC